MVIVAHDQEASGVQFAVGCPFVVLRGTCGQGTCTLGLAGVRPTQDAMGSTGDGAKVHLREGGGGGGGTRLGGWEGRLGPPLWAADVE